MTQYKRRSQFVNVTKFEKMGDHPKVIPGLLVFDDETGAPYWEAYPTDEDPPEIKLLLDTDDPYAINTEEDVVPIINVFRRSYRPVIVGNYIVEDLGGHVISVLTEEELNRKYEPY